MHKINPLMIEKLYDDFNEYLRELTNKLNYIKEKKMQMWWDEANLDNRTGMYKTSALQDKYNHNVQRMREWLNSYEEGNKKRIAKFKKVISLLENIRFSSEDKGIEFIFDFGDGALYKKPNNNPNQYTVTLQGFNTVVYWDPLPHYKITFQPDPDVAWFIKC